MEIDAIGEILNISLGSSATSVSGMLDRRVTITTPVVSVMKAVDFHFQALEPAIGVEINYISGLSGTNVMIMKESDVQAIVGLLLGTDYSEEEFVMDEMSVSAICEVMNQMMGASSTALSQFLNRTVNISTPESFPIEDSEEFKHKYYTDEDDIVTVSFQLMIDEMVNSEFVSVLTIDLAKELIALFSMDDSSAEEAEPEPPAPAMAPPPQPAAAAAPPPSAAVAPPPQQMPPQQMMPPQMYADPMMQQPYYPPQQRPRPQPRVIDPVSMQPPAYESFDDDYSLTASEQSNLNMIMSIPLQVTVEIGRTKKKIKEILEFSVGTIIELNKQAGTPVDVFVNGQVVAKGDVVVVDDYYGVKITEVSSSNEEILKML